VVYLVIGKHKLKLSAEKQNKVSKSLARTVPCSSLSERIAAALPNALWHWYTSMSEQNSTHNILYRSL